MRDEAREHVLSIKSSDLVLNRLLGSGRFYTKSVKKKCLQKKYLYIFLLYKQKV